MDEFEAPAVSVAADTATAPAEQSAPASASETSASAGTPRESRNLDAKADYLSRIQNAATDPNVDPAEAAVAAATAAAAAESATDATVTGESTQTDQTQQTAADGEPQSQNEEPARAPIIPYDQLPENMRGELRKANLAPSVKEALAQAWYERKAFHDTGFSLDHARQLKTFGFTPEAAVERVKLHPTISDAQTDAQLADIARTLMTDFASNPQAMIDGLRSNVPQGFSGFAKAFAGQLKQAAPEVYGDVASDIMWTAVSILERELPEDALDEREHVAYVKAKFFPNQGQGQPGQTNGSLFNPNDPIHKEYQRIVESQQQQHAAVAGQFETALYQYGANAVKTEIAERFKTAAPAGLDEAFVSRAVNDIFAEVSNDVVNNKNVRDQINRILAGNLSQEDLNAAVALVTDRARPLIAVRMRPHLDFWSKAARNQVQSTPAAASRPVPKAAPTQAPASTQRVPGMAPATTSPTAPPADFIKAGRAKGWDNVKLMQQWTAGHR